MNIFYLVHFLFSLNRSSHKQGKHQKIFIILTNIPVYPANMEDHRLAALRELEEEVGASCGRLTYLGCLYSSPGFSSEVLHMYLAQELTEGACHPDEDEFLSVERIPFSALVEQVRQGEIKDAKTVALVLKAKLLGL